MIKSNSSLRPSVSETESDKEITSISTAIYLHFSCSTNLYSFQAFAGTISPFSPPRFPLYLLLATTTPAPLPICHPSEQNSQALTSDVWLIFAHTIHKTNALFIACAMFAIVDIVAMGTCELNSFSTCCLHTKNTHTHNECTFVCLLALGILFLCFSQCVGYNSFFSFSPVSVCVWHISDDV